MHIQNIDVKESSRKPSLGESSPLYDLGFTTSPLGKSFSELFARIQKGDEISDEEMQAYRRDLLRNLACLHVSSDQFAHAMDPEYVASMVEDSELLESMVSSDLTRSTGEIQNIIARMIGGIDRRDRVQIQQAYRDYQKNSLDTTAVDLPRMASMEISIDGRETVKLYEFMGYEDIESFKQMPRDKIFEEFVNKFRESGASDEAITYMLMNFNQKAFIHGHMSAIAAGMRANPGNHLEIKKRRDLIKIQSGKVTMESRASLSMVRLSSGERVDAGSSTIQVELPLKGSRTLMTAEELLKESIGDATLPVRASLTWITPDGVNPPQLDKRVVLQNIEPVSRSHFTVSEVTQTFKECFDLQRGDLGDDKALGIYGRLLDIVNDERSDKGEHKIKNLDGVNITKAHINKLIEKLAAESPGAVEKGKIHEVKEQAFKAIGLRARLNEIDPKAKLSDLGHSIDAKFERFNAFFEFVNKVVQNITLYFQAKQIGEAIRKERGHSPLVGVHQTERRSRKSRSR